MTTTEERAADVDRFPLSYAQERIWFLEQLEPDSAAFTITAALRIDGDLDAVALDAALHDLAARHEVLRTSFVHDGTAPLQRIEPDPAIVLDIVDLTGLEEAVAAARADDLAEHQATSSFDLEDAPLMRATLVLIAPHRGLLLLVLHHTVCDGWSADLLIRDLAELYRARRTGTDPELPDLPIQYADFAVWQRETLAQSGLDEQMSFWRKALDGVPRVLELPTDRPRPAEQDFGGAMVGRELPADVAAGLLDLARAERVSPFMLLLSAYQLVLARRSGQPRFLVGTPVSGRTRPETAELLGCFINMLALPADLTGDPSLRSLLARVRTTCLDGYAHQDLPFEHLVAELDPDRDLGRAPLAQVLLAVQDGLSGPVEVEGATLTPVPVASGVASYDLVLDAELAPEGFRLTLVYATKLFDRETADGVLADVVSVLTALLADPDQPISGVLIAGETSDVGDAGMTASLDAVRSRLAAGPDHDLPVDRYGIVDFCGRPALPGARGSLWVGGDDDGGRFRTHDLVRRLPNGTLQFVGRTDRLLEVEGRLVDPGDVENALTAIDDVDEAAVVLSSAGGLAAFCTPSSLDTERLTEHLRSRLPEHLVPETVTALDALPLTPTGRLDVAALVASTAQASGYEAAVRPRTHLERALLDCFGTALGRRDIGVFDDFFEVGGTSLTAARLIVALPAAVGFPVPLKLLFTHSTVAGLAGALESPDGPVAAESALQLAQRDEHLPADITPDPGAEPRSGKPRRVLLTGGLGFLGGHLIPRLLDSGVEEVVCLLRGENPGERLAAKLRDFGLDVDMSRITVLPGDLSQPLLGQTPEKFAELAEDMDAIFHSGALMNFILPYRVLRAPNVLGTLEILRLACQGRPSAVHFVSTIDSRIGERLPEAAGPLDVGTPDGYILSKKTGEHLVLEAGRRGLPIGVYRPWLITAAARTDAAGVGDQLSLCLAGSLIAGVLPQDTPMPLHVLPVDLVAEAIVRLAAAAPRPNPIHQFYNPQVAPMKHIHAYLEQTGYGFETVPYDDWRVQLARRTAGKMEGLAALLSIAAPMAGDPHEVEIANTLSGLGGDAGFPSLDVDYVGRTVGFLVRHGMIPAIDGSGSPAGPGLGSGAAVAGT